MTQCALHSASVGWVAVGSFRLLVDGILSAVPLGVLPLSLEFRELSTVRDGRVQLPYQEQGQANGHDTDNHAWRKRGNKDKIEKSCFTMERYMYCLQKR